MPEFETDDNKKYKMEVIQASTVYIKEADRYLPGLYYLVVWKCYPEEKNIWKPSLAVMHFQKMVSIFYKNYSEKLTVILVPLNSISPIAKPTIKLFVK